MISRLVSYVLRVKTCPISSICLLYFILLTFIESAVMLPKKQLTFAAFIVLAGRVARTKAQAYKPDVADGGYFTPYFPTDAYDGPSQQSPATTDEEEQPSPTQPPAPENTEYSDGDSITSEVTTSGWTNTRVKPTNPPDNKKYTPVTETLSDGSSYQKGSFNKTLRWQSTGVLQHGKRFQKVDFRRAGRKTDISSFSRWLSS